MTSAGKTCVHVRVRCVERGGVENHASTMMKSLVVSGVSLHIEIPLNFISCRACVCVVRLLLQPSLLFVVSLRNTPKTRGSVSSATMSVRLSQPCSRDVPGELEGSPFSFSLSPSLHALRACNARR